MRELTVSEHQNISGGIGTWIYPAIMIAYTAGRVVHDFTCDDHEDDSGGNGGGGW